MPKYLALAALLFLSSCEQPGTAIDPTDIIYDVGSVPANLGHATPPPPLTLIPGSTPNPIPPTSLNDEPTINTGPRTKVQTGRFGSSVLGDDTGGDAGIFFTQAIAGIYANQTAYPNLTLKPPLTGAFNTLYAPTMKLGNGGCLEYSMDYWNNGAVDSRFLRLYNFCDDIAWNTGVEKAVDAQFEASYLRDLGLGVPQYTIEIVRGSDSMTRALLYNYTQHTWELIYTSSASTDSFDDGESWDFFETHYTAGPCSSVPPIVSSDIQILAGGAWLTLNTDGIDQSSGDCFTDGTTPATNELDTYNQAWVVNSNS